MIIFYELGKVFENFGQFHFLENLKKSCKKYADDVGEEKVADEGSTHVELFDPKRRVEPLSSATSGPFVSIRTLDTRHFVSITRPFVLSDVREKTKRKRWPSPSGEMTSIRPACTPLSVTQIGKLQAHGLCTCVRARLSIHAGVLVASYRAQSRCIDTERLPWLGRRILSRSIPSRFLHGKLTGFRSTTKSQAIRRG